MEKPQIEPPWFIILHFRGMFVLHINISILMFQTVVPCWTVCSTWTSMLARPIYPQTTNSHTMSNPSTHKQLTANSKWRLFFFSWLCGALPLYVYWLGYGGYIIIIGCPDPVTQSTNHLSRDNFELCLDLAQWIRSYILGWEWTKPTNQPELQ